MLRDGERGPHAHKNMQRSSAGRLVIISLLILSVFWSPVNENSQMKITFFRLADLENELMVTRGGRACGGGIDWELGIDIYTLLYFK